VSVDWWAWGWKHGPLNSDHRYVWLALANHADKSGVCWPSISLLMEETRLSESTVRRAINALVSQGWLVRTERGNGRGKLTHYQLVKRVSGGNLLDAEPETPKGYPGDSQRVSRGPEKGVTLTEPPHPHIGVTVNEPSVEPSGGGNRHARSTRFPRSRSRVANTKKLGSPDDESLQAARRIFAALKNPADDGLLKLTASAVRLEAERLGSIGIAETSILNRAVEDARSGKVKAWRFWIQDAQYRLERVSFGGSTQLVDGLGLNIRPL
jgi:GntR family transcriptional regulator